MSEEKSTGPGGAGFVPTEVFKSSEAQVHRFNDATNSAVSDAPVDHTASARHARSVDAASPGSSGGEDFQHGFASTKVAAVQNDALVEEDTNLRASIDATVDIAEQCIENLESAVKRATQLIEEVKTSVDHLVLNDDLRERLRKTMARTERLKQSDRNFER